MGDCLPDSIARDSLLSWSPSGAGKANNVNKIVLQISRAAPWEDGLSWSLVLSSSSCRVTEHPDLCLLTKIRGLEVGRKEPQPLEMVKLQILLQSKLVPSYKRLHLATRQQEPGRRRRKRKRRWWLPQSVSEWQGMHPVEPFLPGSEQTVQAVATLPSPSLHGIPLKHIFVWFFSFSRQKREELAQRVAEERSRREEEARRLEAEQARERAEQLRRQAEEREQREREETERLQKQVGTLGAER